MSEESVIVEVEPESIKTQSVDVKVLSSTVLDEEIPDNINHSEDPIVEVKDTINSVIDEQGDQKDVKEGLLWDEKATDSNELDGRHVRRHSASPLFWGPNRKAVVPSRYRGGSIGSCHDMCKFGHKHTSEVKPKSFMKKTPTSVNASEGKGLMKIALSAENNRRKSVARRLSFPATKPDNDSQMPVQKVKKVSEPKQKPTTASQSLITDEQQESFESSSDGFREIKVIKNEEKSSGLVTETLIRSKPPVKKAATMNSRMHRDSSSLSHLKNHQTNHQKQVKVKLPEDLPEKTLYMIEPNSKTTVAEISQKAKTRDGSYVGTRKGSKATQNGSDNPRLSKTWLALSKKSSKSQREKMDDKGSVAKHTDTIYGYGKARPKPTTLEAKSYTPKLKGFSKAKQNGKQNSLSIQTFLPAVDKPSTSVEGKQAGTESISSKHGDADSKTKPNTLKVKVGTPRSKPGTPKLKQEVESKGKAIKGAKSQNGEGEGFGSVWKMKFRRGKVISLPTGNNSPVKLKFRRPRSFSDSRYAENANKANYKNNEVVNGEDPKKDGADPVKVVLRRHEATHKKDDVDLNNVIEETASKLVMTRKSKVKALVGAFETVMSLRDRKASEATSAS